MRLDWKRLDGMTDRREGVAVWWKVVWGGEDVELGCGSKLSRYGNEDGFCIAFLGPPLRLGFRQQVSIGIVIPHSDLEKWWTRVALIQSKRIGQIIWDVCWHEYSF